MESMRTPARVTTAVLAAGTAALMPPNTILLPTAVADSPVCSATSCSFQSPNRSIDCAISVGSPGVPDSASCAWSDESRALTVKLLPSGLLEPCINQFVDQIDYCKTDPQGALPVLGYGETAVLAPFTCLAEAQAITCTAAPSGRGFTMNSTGILPASVAAPVPAETPVQAPAPEPPAEPPAPTVVPEPPQES